MSLHQRRRRPTGEVLLLSPGAVLPTSRTRRSAGRWALLPTLPLPRQPGREGSFEPRAALSFPAARCRRASAAALLLSAYQRVLVLFWQVCEPRASQFGFSRAGISRARWDPDVAEGARALRTLLNSLSEHSMTSGKASKNCSSTETASSRGKRMKRRGN